MATINPDWGRVLAGVGQGLMSAGQPGANLGNFGSGLMQGAQFYDQGVDRKRARELEDIRLELAKQEQEAQRLANTKAAQEDAALQQLLNGGGINTASGAPAAPNGLSQAQFGGAPTAPAAGGQPFFDPQTAEQIKRLPPSLQRAAVEAQLGKMFADPERDKWGIEKVREGSEEVTYRINPYTGDKEEIARGAAFAPQQDSGVKTSLVPFYATDAQGNLHMYQPSASGVPVEVQLPPGVTPAPGQQFLNTGTAFVPVNSKSGQTGGAIPIDVQGEAAGKAAGGVVGEAQGTATAILPEALAKAEQAQALIKKIKEHPGKSLSVGGSSVFAGGVIPAIPGSANKDFLVAMDQLKGKTFLEAYQSLKGGGAITVIEGTKGEEAIARLNVAQSEAEFDAALNELGEIIDNGVKRMKAKAGGNFAPQPSAGSAVPPPPPGFVVQ